MNRVTASGSGRLLQCSGHVRLPWLRETSAAAQEGTDLHALMEDERHDEHPRTAAAWAAFLAWVDAEGYTLHEAGREYRERAYALDIETRRARVLRGIAHRDYSDARPTEIPGTADLVAELVNDDGLVTCVIDWKFGAEPVEPDSAQMRTLAAMVCLAPDGDVLGTLPGVMAIIVQSPPDGRAVVRAHAYDRDDLISHVEALAEALNDAREGATVLQRGPECKYCPASHACPAQLASLSALVAPGGAGPITPARAGEIWAELRQAKKRLEAIEDACKALAAEGDGLPLPGGKRLVVTQRTRTSMDARQLEAIARGHGASDEEIAACARTTTYSTTQEIKS